MKNKHDQLFVSKSKHKKLLGSIFHDEMFFLLSEAKMCQVGKIENKNYSEPIKSKLSKDYGCKMKTSSSGKYFMF